MSTFELDVRSASLIGRLVRQPEVFGHPEEERQGCLITLMANMLIAAEDKNAAQQKHIADLVRTVGLLSE